MQARLNEIVGALQWRVNDEARPRPPRALTLPPPRWYYALTMRTDNCSSGRCGSASGGVALLWAVAVWALAASAVCGQREEIPRRVVGERLLTFSAYHSPALNPSGEVLAYVNVTVGPDGSMRHDLWAQNLRTGVRLQMSRNSDCSHPAWAPAGDLLAVAAAQRGATSAGLWVMQADGTRQTQVASGPTSDAPRSPVWSPVEANRVAFLSSIEQVPGSNPQHRVNVWMLDISTSAAVPYFLPAEVEVSPDSGLAWGPDGKAVFFLGTPTGQESAGGEPPPAGLWRLNLEDGRFEQVMAPPEAYALKSLALAPSLGKLSALLVPRSKALHKSATLALLEPETGSVHIIKSGLPLPEGESDVKYGQAVTWSADGRTCVVVTGRDLLLLELATRSEVETKGCTANLRKLFAALVAYAQAHQGCLPQAGVGSDGQPLWVAAVTPYLKEVSVLRCPLDDGEGASYDFNPALGGQVLAYLEDRGSTSLLTERVARHAGRRAVLMADGQVRLR